MLEFKPAGLGSWRFTVRENGSEIGALELRRLRAQGTLTYAGRSFEFKREGLLGTFLFIENGRTLARAERIALIRPRYRIIGEDRELLLATRGFLMKHAELLHGDVVAATIQRTSLFKREVRVSSADIAPIPLILFSTVLLIVFWRHQARSNS